MSDKIRQILSTVLTGVLGGVIALVVLALLALGPLRAVGARLNPFAETLPPCIMPPVTPATCQSNEKQLGLGLLQYCQDYDEVFPSGTQSSSATYNGATNGVGWAGSLFPYIKSGSTFTCPFDTTHASRPNVAVSYALNANISDVSQALIPVPGSTVAAFEIGGDVVNVYQSDEGAGQGAALLSAAGNGIDGQLLSGPRGTVTQSVYFATGYLAGRPPLTSGSQFTGAAARDDGGTNVLTTDGRTHYLQPGTVSSGNDAATSNDPQTGGTVGTAAGTNALTASGYQLTFSIR